MAIRNPYVHTVHIHMDFPYGFSISIRLMDRKPGHTSFEIDSGRFSVGVSIDSSRLLNDIEPEDDILKNSDNFWNIATLIERKKRRRA
jgi:hypothetical protein